MNKKKRIYYARTYRRIKLDMKISILFTCLLMIPSLVVFILNIDTITQKLAQISTWVLSQVFPAESISVIHSHYSIFGTMQYVELPTTYPEFSTVCFNLVLCFGIYLLMRLFKQTGKPMGIFLLYTLLVHVVNCVFFVFGGEEFPYTLGGYSDLYIKQQIGIWIMFIILASLVVGFIGKKMYGYKILTFLGIMLYSMVYGGIRYIVFLFFLHKFSVLYMALMFFVIGPMFDFSYFVAIYAIFINKIIKEYDFGKKKGEWKWS